ncbi:MAG: glycoside hydrolase family 2 [Clostridia bacterium]|nr:glycoside hydrolase family 2 [Clostridia bacterium]
MNAWQTYYPRPQLRRDSFLSLCDDGWTLNGRPITAPFPPQSPLSGFGAPVGEQLHYEKRFTLPEGFLAAGQRLIMHLGAVDYQAEVSINGVHVVSHEGGYLSFSADVTDELISGENLLAVDVTDRLERDTPHGKQSKKPGGMWYTPVSGIWQSVWLEAVPQVYIRGVKIVPDLTGIDLTVDSDAPACRVQVLLDGAEVACVSFPLTGDTQRVEIPNAHRRLWTPDAPCLYDLVIRAGEDTVRSYFALRTIGICPDAGGVQRVCLNGQPMFLNAVLDQGYFPGGIYLPEEPEEYECDILRMKALGFNMLRKHIKVEPECFYHACDRLGMLVMQDMVSGGPYSWLMDTALPTVGFKRTPHLPKTRLWKTRFEKQARETVAHLHNHPCIVAYTIFNEGWGQFEPERMYHTLRGDDPTRFYDVCSGWFAPKETDVDSLHVYFRNKRLHPGKRPMFLSECGGYARAIPGHLWKPDADYGYGKTDTAAQLTAAIGQMYREMVLPAIPEGLCGVVYTQLSDVEEEINGLYTYDRQVCKVDGEEMRRILKAAEERLK